MLDGYVLSIPIYLDCCVLAFAFAAHVFFACVRGALCSGEASSFFFVMPFSSQALRPCAHVDPVFHIAKSTRCKDADTRLKGQERGCLM